MVPKISLANCTVAKKLLLKRKQKDTTGRKVKGNTSCLWEQSFGFKELDLKIGKKTKEYIFKENEQGSNPC